nr:hypothetical protein [Tanacetum cinerariifolium]
MSKFFFKRAHNSVRPLSNNDPPTTTSWSGEFGCKATVKLVGRVLSSLGVPDDVPIDAHSADGTACIAFSRGRPMIPLSEPIETVFIEYFHRGTTVYIHAVDYMSAYFCFYDE